MTDTSADSVGSRIASARKAKGLTQQDLASPVGVSFQAVSKWETEQTLPDVALLTRIADILDMTLDELVAGRTPTPASKVEAAEPGPRVYWDQILGVVTEDIHGDVGSVLGQVQADIYGNVLGTWSAMFATSTATWKETSSAPWMATLMDTSRGASSECC